MNTRLLASVVLVSLLAAALPARAAEMTRFVSKPGRNSKMRIEGTSNIHDWRAESALIGGTLEVGPGFPTTPGAVATPGKVEATAMIFIPVTSFFSLKEDNVTKYSDAMDNRMYAALTTTNRITYHLKELTLKEGAKSKDAPYIFEAVGDLSVAGVTNKITMPVNVLPLGDKALKISGQISVKMTSFGIQPPSPAISAGLIKTGDDVKLIFEWVVIEKAAPAK